MAKKAKKTGATASQAHTDALRENTRALKQHTKMLEAAINTHTALTTALVHHAAALRAAAKPTTDQITSRLETATGNGQGSFKPDDKVINVLNGEGPARDALMSDINQEFWPGAEIPHLRWNQIKGMMISQLAAKIQSML